ncbi:hypothetical protein [Cellulosimicrobium protaetiae]|uniref:Uncharacterized protein n=1 Tax=Cellulosimicrobium protaetiae TaxID=2587808 RepID=A0A6M5UIY1_9MICO|nr:hypothetical protein [Cellulosimicrobium protaetiae]QJW38100.1 hypothetical protein FIC82_019905 [Cellulosimicrobium protaetiae]
MIYMKKSRLLTFGLVALAGSVGLAGGIIAADKFGLGSSAVAVAPGDRTGVPEGIDLPPDAVNAKGQSYGSMVGRENLADAPDLILVVGNDGKEGYAKKEDLLKEPPSSPEEAVSLTQKRSSDTIPVYDVNGEEIVDSYTIDPAQG